MATVIINQLYGINQLDISFSNMFSGSVTSHTSTNCNIGYSDGTTDIFSGSGFTYDENFFPTSGTLATYGEAYNGTIILTIGELHISFESIIAAAKTVTTDDDLSLMASALKGNDFFAGGGGADALYGFAGSDIINGNGGADTLTGGAGNDRLAGGAGDDQLHGEAGRDTFVFSDGDETDTIVGFKASGKRHDIIDFSELTNIENFSQVKAAAENHGKNVWIDAGGGDVLIITQTHAHDLLKADFSF